MHPIRLFRIAILLSVTLGGSAACAATPANPALPQVTLRIAGRPVIAEVAATAQERETGLMLRRGLAADHGMVFVFGTPQRVCMWMKNTRVPLSVAFIGSDGRVVNLADMQPLSEAVHCSDGAVRYALEMPLHWFARHGVRPGAPIGGLPPAR